MSCRDQFNHAAGWRAAAAAALQLICLHIILQSTLIVCHPSEANTISRDIKCIKSQLNIMIACMVGILEKYQIKECMLFCWTKLFEFISLMQNTSLMLQSNSGQ